VNGWSPSGATINWNWSDGGAGLDPTACATSTAVTGTGTITQTCTDLLGNQGSASLAVKVDGTASAVSATAAGVPTAGCSTVDSESGVKTNAVATTVTNTDGSFTVTCSGGEDNVGNKAADVAVTYTVTAVPAPTVPSSTVPSSTVPSSTVPASTVAAPISYALLVPVSVAITAAR
jgi:hypothetical protein